MTSRASGDGDGTFHLLLDAIKDNATSSTTWPRESTRPNTSDITEHLMTSDAEGLLLGYLLPRLALLQDTLAQRHVIVRPAHTDVLDVARERAWRDYTNLRRNLMVKTPDDRAQWSGPQRFGLAAAFVIVLGWEWLTLDARSAKAQEITLLKRPLPAFPYVSDVIEQTDVILVIDKSRVLEDYRLSHWSNVLTPLVDKCIPRIGWHPGLPKLWDALWAWFAMLVHGYHPAREADAQQAAQVRGNLNGNATFDLHAKMVAKFASLGLDLPTRQQVTDPALAISAERRRLHKSTILDLWEHTTAATDDANGTMTMEEAEDAEEHLPIVYGSVRLSTGFLLEMEAVYYAHTTAFRAFQLHADFSTALNTRATALLRETLVSTQETTAAAWRTFFDYVRHLESATIDQSVRNGVFTVLGRAYLTIGEMERYFVVRHELARLKRDGTRQVISSLLAPDRIIAERRQADYIHLRKIRASASQIYDHVVRDVISAPPVDGKDGNGDDDNDGESLPVRLGHIHEPLAVLLMTEVLHAQLASYGWPETANILAASWIEEYKQTSAVLPLCPPSPEKVLDIHGQGSPVVLVRFLRKQYVLVRFARNGAILHIPCPTFENAILVWLAFSVVGNREDGNIQGGDAPPGLGPVVTGFRSTLLRAFQSLTSDDHGALFSPPPRAQ